MAEKKKVSVKASASAEAAEAARTWEPTPEAKSKAIRFRIFAAILWAIAIAAEIVAIFWIIRSDRSGDEKLWWLIGFIVGIGVFALAGSFLWKKANRLDPASEKDKFRFFVQNQLGVIITVIAFLPLIVLIFLDKDMDGKQKGIVGGIAIAVAVAVGLLSADWNAPSKEQYTVETNTIKLLKNGVDEVFWTKSGKVFHVCDKVPDVNKQSKDNTIYNGTVAAAHEAGKDRLTARWESEAINYCGYTQADVDRVNKGLAAIEASTEPSAVPSEPGTEAPGNVTPLPSKPATTTQRPAA